MPTDPKKRQKKLERRAAKRKERKHDQVRERTAGLPERLTIASRFPVLHCWIGDSLSPEADQGIGWVVLSRSLPTGQVAAASFLVDAHCLGVKDTYAEIMSRVDYEAKYVHKITKEMPSRNASPPSLPACRRCRASGRRRAGMPNGVTSSALIQIKMMRSKPA